MKLISEKKLCRILKKAIFSDISAYIQLQILISIDINVF